MAKVKLKKPVKIAGEQHKSGDVVSVSDSSAEWLIARGAAEKVTAAKRKGE